MALTAEEEKLVRHALSSLPHWFRTDRQFEDLGAMAKAAGASIETIRNWFKHTLITTATGPETAGDADWLGQHAIDRGTRRQLDETDEALRERLRNIPDAITVVALTAAAQSIMALYGISDPIALLEMPRDAAYIGTFISDTGTGGEFSDPGSGLQFTATVNPRAATLLIGDEIEFSGSLTNSNNGTYTITGLNGNGIQFTNGAAVSEIDPGVTWTHIKRNKVTGELIDGWSRAYLDRGYRVASPGPKIIMILPFGCTPAIRASIIEMLRQKKAGGVAASVECRLIA